MNRRWWMTLNVSIGVYMSTLDASIVNISLPTITRSFNAPLKMVAWVVTAYLIVITGCLLIMGRLTDLFGQRRIYLLGFSTFTLGSALCGLSPDHPFSHRLQDPSGPGGRCPDGERARDPHHGFSGGEAGPGPGHHRLCRLGWFFDGAHSRRASWWSTSGGARSFSSICPSVSIGIFLSRSSWKRLRPQGRAPLDLRGAFLIFIFITSLLLFLSQVSQGSNPFVWGWFSLSLICFGLLILVELRSPSPLIDLHLFKQKLFIASLGTSLLSFWLTAAHAFVLPFFLQDILNIPPPRWGCSSSPFP